MTLFNGNPVDLDAFNKGLQACIDSPQSKNCKGIYPPMAMLNPYQVNSDQWHSWNKGWDSYDRDKQTVTIEVTQSIQPDVRLATPDELKSREITDFKITEISLMPDGTYQPAFSFSPKDLNVSQSTLDQLRSQVRKLPDAQMWMIDNHDVVAGPFSIPGEQYEQLKRLADSQEDGEIAPIDNDL